MRPLLFSGLLQLPTAALLKVSPTPIPSYPLPLQKKKKRITLYGSPSLNPSIVPVSLASFEPHRPLPLWPPALPSQASTTVILSCTSGHSWNQEGLLISCSLFILLPLPGIPLALLLASPQTGNIPPLLDFWGSSY